VQTQKSPNLQAKAEYSQCLRRQASSDSNGDRTDAQKTNARKSGKASLAVKAGAEKEIWSKRGDNKGRRPQQPVRLAGSMVRAAQRRRN
jgi:hypothetical protein